MTDANAKNLHVPNWALAKIRKLEKRIEQLEKVSVPTVERTPDGRTLKLAEAIPVALRVDAPEFRPSAVAASFNLAEDESVLGHDLQDADVSPLQMWYEDAEVRLGVDPVQELLDDFRSVVCQTNVPMWEVLVQSEDPAGGGESAVAPTLDASAPQEDGCVEENPLESRAITEWSEPLSAELKKEEGEKLLLQAIESQDMTKVLELVQSSTESLNIFARLFPFLAGDFEENIAARQRDLTIWRKELKTAEDLTKEAVLLRSTLHGKAATGSARRRLAHEMRLAEGEVARALANSKDAEGKIESAKGGILTLLRLRQAAVEASKNTDCEESVLGFNSLD